MNLKKMIFINTIITFLLCFLTHFLYEWLPNPIFAILFPVNESIWEHMKMMYTTILLYGIIEYLIMKKFKIIHNNFLLSTFSKSIIAIPIYLIIFLPLYNIFGENMFISISLLLITIFVVNLIGYSVLKLNEFTYQKTISILGIILFYIIMGYLTYNPPMQEIFFDIKEQKYGIDKYIEK